MKQFKITAGALVVAGIVGGIYGFFKHKHRIVARTVDPCGYVAASSVPSPIDLWSSLVQQGSRHLRLHTSNWCLALAILKEQDLGLLLESVV
jgi:hypothetical protein